MDWFLYDIGLHHERVNGKLHFLCSAKYCKDLLQLLHHEETQFDFV